MPQRIVVSFRGVVPAGEGGGAKYLERALALKKRAGALGGTLCAWSATTFSIDFGPDDLEEALSLALLVSEGEASGPVDQRFGAGVALGEMRTVGEGGSLSMLSWGAPLVDAVALSRETRAGETLVDPELLAARGNELDELGFAVEVDGAGRARLERTRPAAPPPPPRPSMPPSMRISSPGIPPPPASGRISVTNLVAAPVAPPLAEDAPVTVRASSIPARATLPSIPTFSSSPPGAPSVPPRDSSSDLTELAKRALVQGDVTGLERLIEELRDTGAHAELVERMSGMVALQRGATAEALRRLRAAAEAVREPSQRARARLAYGVALATAGRTEGALLEGLEALARAREASDAHGEHACALFLARLSAAAGHQDAAGAWAFVAARRSA